jgi:hypothetical protein
MRIHENSDVDEAKSTNQSALSIGLLLLGCGHGAIWSTFFVNLIEPPGSGGFALHLFSLQCNLGLLLIVLIHFGVSVYKRRPVWLHVTSAVCLIIGYVTSNQ